MRIISFGFLLFLVFSLINCSKENLSETINDSSSLESIASDESPGICTELYAEDPSRAFGPKNLFWNKNTLRVRFLGGSSYVQSKVRQYATEWSKYANMTLEFVDSEPSDIRISFDSDDGSWSYIGRTNSYIPSYRATMNFGWFNTQTSNTEFRRTTLHEFGHALGLAHEHQHPQASINWNRDAVYSYYQQTQDWSKSDVDANIFDKYSINTTNYTEYDPRSIMHYYIPRSLVYGNWNPTFNTTLSNLDIQFIKKMYPGSGGTETVDDCSCPDSLAILSCDDFESYEQDTYEASPYWSKWSNTSGFGELQTYTWGKVVKIDYNYTQNPDVLYNPGSLNTSQFKVSWDMYVGSGSSAYFNIQKYTDPGTEFGAQIYLETDQSGRIEINNQEADFTYRQNTWNRISLAFDFEQKITRLIINDQVIASWPSNWTAQSANGVSKFGAINFYAIDQDALFWLDDFCVSSDENPVAMASSAIFHSDVTGLKK